MGDHIIMIPNAEDRVSEKELVEELEGGVRFHHGRIWKADAIILVEQAFSDGSAIGVIAERNRIAKILKEPSETLVSEVAWDIYDDRESIKAQVRRVFTYLADHL